MDFDKSKILTCVTADQAKVGMKGWFADNLIDLENKAINYNPIQIVVINSDYNARRFVALDTIPYALFYPAPEPTYRPFANAEEFKPYRDKWCIDKLKGRFKIDWHSDTHIYEYGNSFITWEEAFRKYKFEDGTSFGVEVEEYSNN